MKGFLAGILVCLSVVTLLLVERHRCLKRCEKLEHALAALEHQKRDSEPISCMPPTPLGRSFEATPQGLETSESVQIGQTKRVEPRDEHALGAEQGSSDLPADEREPIEDVYEQEQRDQDWASTSEAELMRGLTKVSTGQTRIARVECRTSVCRADVVHGGEPEVGPFAELLMREFRWNGPTQYMRREGTPQGDVQSTLYFAKNDEHVNE